MPINSPTGFLDITNATLRTSNLEAQNLKINGGNIYVTVENTSFPTDTTINFTNPTSAFTTTSNIEVGNANLFVDTLNSRVGILTSTPASTLDVNGGVTATSFSDGTSTLTGGTWSGSAASLTTPVNIGGVSFDGSASIVPTTFGAATFSGDVTVDTTTLHVDATNSRVGIGTTTPSSQLELYGTGKDLTFKNDAAISRRSATTRDAYYSDLENSIKRVGDRNVFDGSPFTPDTTHEILMGFSDTYTQYQTNDEYYPTHNEMRFKLWNTTNSTTGSLVDIITLRGDGHVGVGTVSPRSPLTVFNSDGMHITPTYTVNYSQTSRLDFNYGGGTAGTLSSIRLKCEAVNRDNGAGPYYDYGAQGKLIFQGKTNNTYSGGANDITYTDIMTIDGANSRVGIGTTSPQGALHVAGDSGLSNTSQALGVHLGVHNSTYAHIELVCTDTNSGWIDFKNANTSGNGDYEERIRGGDGNLAFHTNKNERMRIGANGNVCVNTTSTNATFDVNGSLRAKRFFGSGDGSFSGSGTFNLPPSLNYGSTDKPHIGWEIHLAFGFSGTNYGTFSITGAEDSSGSISNVSEGNSIQLRDAGVNWSNPSSTTYLTANRETVAPTYYAIIRIVQAVEANIATGSSTRWHFQYQCTGCHAGVGATTYFGSGFFQFPTTARRIKYLRLNCDTGSVSGNYYFVAIS